MIKGGDFGAKVKQYAKSQVPGGRPTGLYEVPGRRPTGLYISNRWATNWFIYEVPGGRPTGLYMAINCAGLNELIKRPFVQFSQHNKSFSSASTCHRIGAMATGRGRADLFALGACLRLFLRPAADEQLTVLATLHPNNTSNPR